MILLDESTLVATLAESITCQMRAKLSVELTEKQALDIARNLAQAVLGLEVEPAFICNECGDDESADHTECVEREEYANTETEVERLSLRSMWSMPQ